MLDTNPLDGLRVQESHRDVFSSNHSFSALRPMWEVPVKGLGTIFIFRWNSSYGDCLSKRMLGYTRLWPKQISLSRGQVLLDEILNSGRSRASLPSWPRDCPHDDRYSRCYKKKTHKNLSLSGIKAKAYVAVWTVTLLSQIAMSLGCHRYLTWRSWFSEMCLVR